MATFFVLIFLATVIGIIKPYIKNLNRKHFAIAAFASFVAVAVTAPDNKTVSETSKNSTAVSPSEKPVQENGAKSNPEPTSKWQYSNDKDEMRGTTTHLASITSENTIDLDFPYGEVSGILTVRKRPEDGLNIAFGVEKGQILCHSFGDSFISVKFDDKAVQRYSCTGTSDGSSETAFLKNENKFLQNLKVAKTVIIEAEFFQKGRQQFKFETVRLDWKW